METITTPLSQKEQTARKLSRISLYCLPLFALPAALFLSVESYLPFGIAIAAAILAAALAAVAWFTRHRAPAILSLLMPFASIALTILCILNSIGKIE